MRKEPKPSRGNGLINLLFIVVVGWIVISLYQEGHLDKLIGTFQDGHHFTSIEEATCDELKETAIGRELSNTEGTWEVMGVRNIEEVSRSNQELICSGEVLTKGGNFSIIEISLSDWDGEIFLKWRAY